MIIFGGYEEDSEEFARYVYKLDLDTMRWFRVHTNGNECSSFLLVI